MSVPTKPLAALAVVLISAASVLLALSPQTALSDVSIPRTMVMADGAPLMALGMMGPYDPSQYMAMRAAGVTDVLLEMSWARAEPSQGTFDATYLTSIGTQARALRADGFNVALSTGMMMAPDWLLALPGARYVDQAGESFTSDPVPNLIFGDTLRAFAQQYLTTLFSYAGTDFANVRAGGGLEGELSYPYEIQGNGRISNLYWAFDTNAAASDPVPGWKPGQPSPHGEAATFLTWYLDSLVNFQNWQVSALRTAGYHGAVTMLYPSYGMRPGDFAAATATNLSGTSSPEVNGEVQRGYDFARQISALTDPEVVVYSTWGEAPAPVRYLAGLATTKGLPFMAENSGGNTAADLDTALHTAASVGASTFYLVRAPQFFCDCSGFARLSQVSVSYASALAAIAPTAPATPTTAPVPTVTAAPPTVRLSPPAVPPGGPSSALPGTISPVSPSPVSSSAAPAHRAVKAVPTVTVRGVASRHRATVTAVVRVRALSGHALPTGTVNVAFVGPGMQRTIKLRLRAGVATVTIAAHKRGTYVLSAHYSGDAAYRPGSVVRYAFRF